MTWLMITPSYPVQDAEDEQSVPDDVMAEVPLPPALRFKVRDLTVAERAEMQSRVRELTDNIPDPAQFLNIDEDDTDAQVRAATLLGELEEKTRELQMFTIATYVTEIDGYDSIEDVPDFYLPAIAEKAGDFTAARKALSWRLDVGTAVAKPAMGRR